MRVVEVERSRISLQWQPAKESVKTPVDGYVIEMATGNSTDFTPIGRVDGSTCNFDVTGLKDGQVCNFRIRTQNPSGTSTDFAQLSAPVTTPSCGENENAPFRIFSLPKITSFSALLTKRIFR